MHPLEKRIDQLEQRVDQLEAQLVDKEATPTVKHNRRHTQRRNDPEQAIRRAQQQNAVWLFQGIRVLGLTIFLCFLCWGGVVLYEYADEYFQDRGSSVVLDIKDPRR